MPVVNTTTAVSILLTLGLLFSAYRYSRLSFTAPKKIILILVRSCWILLFLLCFLQPEFMFERLDSDNQNIPVLVDASRSMQLFTPESSITPFLDSLKSFQKRSKNRFSLTFMQFGDSLREITDSIAKFNDAKSSFPFFLPQKEFSHSRDLILVSDGHWSNPKRSSEVFPGKNVHFLELPEATPKPHVNISHSAPETAQSDSVVTVSTSANGYSEKPVNLKIELKRNGSVLKKKTLEVQKGYFNVSTDLNIKNTRPGRKLYELEAQLDSISTKSHFVHQTIPHFLTYSMYSATPSLDQRYISQALISRNDFKVKKKSPDLLFIFDWDDKAARLLGNLPSHGTAVFLGCLPCSSQPIKNAESVIRQKTTGVMDESFDLRTLPPPEVIITCPKKSISNKRVMLNSIISGDEQSRTVPVLFSGKYRRRPSLFCSVKGIWKWDFWPMSVNRAENESFAFSKTLLSKARDILLNNISDTYLLYPPEPACESDSVRMMMALPSSTPVFEPLSLSLIVKDTAVVMDTSYTYTPQGLNNQSVTLSPLPAGSYEIESELKTEGSRFSSKSSFSVQPDQNELSVKVQNSLFLQKFARPVDLNEENALDELLSILDQRSMEEYTITENIRIQRSWFLLALILSFIAAELILRKKWGVD
ncbi:MAG: hypothetical protein ACLFTW_05660 [Chitinispirillaceae bacterium]